MVKILTYEEVMDQSKFEYQDIKLEWELYCHRNIDTLVTWVNKRLLNLKSNSIDSPGFYKTIDYEFLYGIFNEQPPSFYKDGLMLFIEILMHRVNAAEGWHMRVVSGTPEKYEIWIGGEEKKIEPEKQRSPYYWFSWKS